MKISIHAPHEGERLNGANDHLPTGTFQSTLPTRGSDFIFLLFLFAAIPFQSTLPTRGSDTGSGNIVFASAVFQSTLPTRGSDCPVLPAACCSTISIHAPHEGERHTKSDRLQKIVLFQSTLPTRGSDYFFTSYSKRIRISIHAPHEGERRLLALYVILLCDFNPRSPRGGATR